MKKIIVTIIAITLLTTYTTAQSISAYLIGNSAPISEVKTKLKESGFDILATTNNVITISNPELQATNTYVATINVYVGSSDIRVQNPNYFGAAYLDDKYKKDQFKSTINALTKALGKLKESNEKLEEDELGDYHFMMGMPYFDEPITVAEGDKIYKKIKNNQHIAYALTLPNGTILVGHKLTPSTSSFLKTLNQTKNSQILPYEALVFSNEVKIMNPKFYLALSLPQLSMGEFMKISTTPNKIEKEITNAYR